MMPKRYNSVIYLIGFMGSGKSTVGRLLATKLGYSFVDTDEMITAQAGMTINEIFSQHGEAHFRKLEHDVVKQLYDAERTVVSTGGGLPMYHDNMKLIQAQGISIYLATGLATIINRIKHDRGRPLLKNQNPQDLALLLKMRKPTYLKADYVVQGHRAPELIVQRILFLLKIRKG